MTASGWRLGVDIGGTFTDFAVIDQGCGTLHIHKQLTTPHDPSESVLSGIPVLLHKAGVDIAEIDTIVHGTTLVANALIERKGARTAMLVTAGFADVLDIALERRYDMYDLRARYPAPLVPRGLRVEVEERITADGRVTVPLDARALVNAVARLVREDEIESLAVCFLNSPVNPTHEAAAVSLLRDAHPALAVASSADVVPFLREYERWSTTVMNAFVQPMFSRYVARLQEGLSNLGFVGSLAITTSSGGCLDPQTARRYPIRVLESGPAAGVLMASLIGQRAAADDLLAFDMGGTTAKGALIRGGRPLKRFDIEVARVHEFKPGSGLSVKTPVIDLIEIGAGGGSLAGVDARGLIKVGPQSAGAEPGPACYARGGVAPTLTDANLVLGYLDPASFLGGNMTLDRDAAHAALARGLGGALKMQSATAAWGVQETINEQVVRAFRNHAAERGFDYRGTTMVAFGGAGPLHALRVASKLRVTRVVFAAGAGVMSSIGLLASPQAFELLQSDWIELDALDAASFDRRFASLIQRAAAPLRSADNSAGDGFAVTRAIDMRYRGQGYEIEVVLPDGGGAELLHRLPDLFDETYTRVFAKTFAKRPIEIVNWKVEVSVPAPNRVADYRLTGRRGAGKRIDVRPAWLPETADFVETPVYDRYALEQGDTITGPALIEERESTVVLGRGDHAVIAASGDLIATPARIEAVT